MNGHLVCTVAAKYSKLTLKIMKFSFYITYKILLIKKYASLSFT